jgi:hypothetical protein
MVLLEIPMDRGEIAPVSAKTVSVLVPGRFFDGELPPMNDAERQALDDLITRRKAVKEMACEAEVYVDNEAEVYVGNDFGFHPETVA